ncbi:MlaC/ttg2D family ABC transporter substrate-binding protein [Verminephrobacter aporrectodeae]|uniref:MlaC/ttg2D family ABC transporter substrate-binding protein n=1 Tax=Verminephrobacter aporrectodeae TaxID=1110389 RepID=UPI00223893B7|nr:ABC transporter substrate-binding protein [Verminephrobacter aporrectodeae]MCW5223240.1 ABC transporter substrate-binding protein [Verminephrobacter aporrectodeae subsp. tuberculatae]MCW5288704.1 ABC transporter substrate-binding protein [Verminephrobacter aporrectodeae subsp. tuberculatae]MCW8175605.1 ABC transporter substrate-binding protein [Verminephrobacter aporrectodeae subsp. tuberculatae]MCW8203162.1 ABC transporter substrate-binding protein [Verminephrobacter aporrectodeae subsp. tu
MMNRRSLGRTTLCLAASASLGLPLPALAGDEAADALVKRLTNGVLDAVKSDKSIQNGELDKLVALVDRTVMPHVNFRRITAATVGPGWRQATPEQQKRLQEEFKILLVRTYAGALTRVSEQTVQVRPLRAAPQDKDVLVRTEILGRGAPIQLDYRLEKTPGNGAGWKIYNMNVLGVWLAETYRSQFTQVINTRGIDGLIETLVERNKANAAKG